MMKAWFTTLRTLIYKMAFIIELASLFLIALDAAQPRGTSVCQY